MIFNKESLLYFLDWAKDKTHEQMTAFCNFLDHKEVTECSIDELQSLIAQFEKEIINQLN